MKALILLALSFPALACDREQVALLNSTAVLTREILEPVENRQGSTLGEVAEIKREAEIATGLRWRLIVSAAKRVELDRETLIHCEVSK